MVANTHCDMEALMRTRRSDPIQKNRCERRCEITVDVAAGEKTGLEFDGGSWRLLFDSQISNVNVACWRVVE